MSSSQTSNASRSGLKDPNVSGSSTVPGKVSATPLTIDLEASKYGVRQTVPLKCALPLFLGLVFAAIGIAVTIVWTTSQSALRSESIGAAQDSILTMSNTLLKSTDASIVAQVEQFFADVQFKVDFMTQIQNGTSPTLRRGVFDDYYWFFFNTMKLDEQITGMTYVDAEKGYSYLSVTQDSGIFSYQLMLNTQVQCTFCNISGGATPPNAKLYFPIASDGTPGTVQSRPSTGYSVAGKTWYQNATTAGTVIWTTFVAHNTGGVGGVSCVRPFYSNTSPGTIAGVLSIDILVTPLSTFLETIVETTGGSAYIMDPYGGLIASSTGEPTAVVKSGATVVQVAAAQSLNPFTRYTAPLTFNQTSPSGIRMDPTFWYMYQTFQDQPGLATFHGTVVFGRESVYYTNAITTMIEQFDSFLRQAVRNSALITIAFIVGGFASVVMFVYYLLLNPLEVVKTGMVKATKFDFTDLKERRDASDASFFSEINALQFVFRAMITSFAKALQSNRKMMDRPATPSVASPVTSNVSPASPRPV
ncbi:hypothetical protein HDU87_002339 [Geranomyces variabilis]|uniref:Cache domain-containing protein n=1 Tax=Geranomyces variabilis TaxID=109894 RepID=A0AAD5XL35_9FUNG|nr:hypothetical protein HDU87_002339 [Geranomyces variabilis]